MKVEARQVEAFLRDPGAARAVLLHGDDAGLIRERADRLVLAAAGSRDDPFRVVELGDDAGKRIGAELASLSLTGGRRVVRVRDAADALANGVAQALAGPGQALLVLEGPGLGTRSRLKQVLERLPDAATIACYPPDGAELAEVIRRDLKATGTTLDQDALRWLCDRLGGDTATTRTEIAKLALFAGSNGHVDLAAAEACIGDVAGLTLEDALFAATLGDVAAADRSLERALSEGMAPVGIVRAALGHGQRLHRAKLGMVAQGMSAGEAARGVRPPVFFKREPDFIRALTIWPEPALATVNARLREADLACKRTGAPAESIARATLLGVAQRAAVLQQARSAPVTRA